MSIRFPLIAFLLALAACSAEREPVADETPAPAPADSIYIGDIVTVDDSNPSAAAVAVAWQNLIPIPAARP